MQVTPQRVGPYEIYELLVASVIHDGKPDTLAISPDGRRLLVATSEPTE